MKITWPILKRELRFSCSEKTSPIFDALFESLELKLLGLRRPLSQRPSVSLESRAWARSKVSAFDRRFAAPKADAFPLDIFCSSEGSDSAKRR